jgi:hypothetical protein
MAVAVFFSIQARYGANATPTVIFIVMDTLRADRASLCGYAHPITPELEALVERGASVFRKGSEASSPDMPCSSSSAALWLGETKLIANQGQVQRFDLRTDPGEKQPYPADDHPAAAELLEYCRALDRAHASRPVPDAELDEELRAQLKALGYLRDDDEQPPPQPSKPD